jgi:hypothetical protein
MPAPYTDRGVKVVVDGTYRRTEIGPVSGITGEATNVSGKDLSFCTISLDVLDESGTKVSSAIANTPGLKAGQTWRFQAIFTTPFTVAFKSIAQGQVHAVAQR